MATYEKIVGPNGEIYATVTLPPTPTNQYKTYKNFSKGQLVTFKGKTGSINEIGDNGMTAFVKSEGLVPVDINTVNLFGGKSRRKTRKSRKNKSRRYRRV